MKQNNVSNARLTLYSSKYQLVKQNELKVTENLSSKKSNRKVYTQHLWFRGNSATKEIDLRSKSVTKLEVLTSQDEKQPQLTVESEVGNVVLKWEPIKMQ